MFKVLLSLLILISGSVQANRLIEQTFPRDNAVCYVNKKRLEMSIRGDHRTTDPNEMGMGEHVLYSLGTKFDPLPLSQPETETYRLFKGKDPVCTRGQGFHLSNGTFAVLFLKENGPYKEKLVIQLFDAKSLLPKEYLDTEFLTDEAKKQKDGFAFLNHPERTDLDMGRVQIEGETFTYQDRIFSTWMSYSSKGFELLPSETYKALDVQNFYKTEAEFFTATGWDPQLKKFSNTTIYFAVNHALKKECILFTNARRKLTENEIWRCHQRM